VSGFDRLTLEYPLNAWKAMHSTELRNAGQRKSAPFYFFSGLVWLIPFLVFIRLRSTGAKPLPFAWVDVPWAVNAVLWVSKGVLAMRSGIRLDDEGLSARWRIWTRRLRWQEIERFDVGPSTSLWLLAIRPHGRPVRLQGYARKYEDEAMSTLHVLNDELQRHRTPPASGLLLSGGAPPAIS